MTGDRSNRPKTTILNHSVDNIKATKVQPQKKVQGPITNYITMHMEAIKRRNIGGP